MRITKQRLQELQKVNLLLLAEHGEPKFTSEWFPYTSGEIGPYYIQSVAVEQDGNHYRTAIDSLCEIIKGTTDLSINHVISGGETRDWDFSNPVAYALGLPHSKLYKKKAPIGARLEGATVIHVADLNNEGSSLRDYWHPIVKENGGEMTHAFFYVDRREDGFKVVENLGLDSHAVIPFNETAWQILLDNNIISHEVYVSLNQRMEDKKNWAHQALRNHIGRLINMLGDEQNRPKAEKIINVGYPELKEELIQRMKEEGFQYQPKEN